MLDGYSFQFFGVIAALGMMAAFLIGQAMDGIMRSQGFGPFGNTLILSSGFVLGVSLTQQLGYAAIGLDGQTVLGVATGFAALLAFALIKLFVLRL